MTATEILLPLKREIPFSKRAMLSPGIVCILLLGYGIFLLIPQKGRDLTPGIVLFSIMLIVLSTGALIAIALALLGVGVGARSPDVVRIDHEGMFFSHLFPTVVTWSEIASLVPYSWTFLGLHPIALGIIPLDPEAMVARIIAHRSRNAVSRFLTRVNIYFYRRSSVRTPLNISQAIVPIPIDELITLIQERFANELREHNISVLGWQD